MSAPSLRGASSGAEQSPLRHKLVPLRHQHKLEAISHAGEALRTFITREFAETLATFVSVPCSKAATDPEYDNRLAKVLASALHGWKADVRYMLRLKHSTPADHESAERLTLDELRAITEIEGRSDNPPRQVIVIVDDVLNSGKHFKVARSLIRERYPSMEIRGVFSARCAREGDGNQPG
jgi:predicted amidophosphoribosyltransferase